MHSACALTFEGGWQEIGHLIEEPFGRGLQEFQPAPKLTEVMPWLAVLWVLVLVLKMLVVVLGVAVVMELIVVMGMGM